MKLTAKQQAFLTDLREQGGTKFLRTKGGPTVASLVKRGLVSRYQYGEGCYEVRITPHGRQAEMEARQGKGR
jgi:hypothetical protein